MSLQERPADPSVGPKRDEMGSRTEVLVLTKLPVTDDDRMAAAKYVRRWAVKNKIKDWQEVLDALGLI